MKMRWFVRPLNLFLVAAVFSASSCALVNGTKQRVEITTNIGAARVFVDGRPVGRIDDEGKPLIVPLERKAPHTVTASKEGYRTRSATVDSRVSFLGILDLIGACVFLLPGVSFVAGTAWELEPSTVYLELDRDQPATVVQPAAP
jgi:hypothetical protein